MPQQALYVTGVKRIDTAEGRFVYQVFTRQAHERVWSERFSTSDVWKASLCQEASQLGQPVTIGSRDTKWGLEIVTCSLEGLEA